MAAGSQLLAIGIFCFICIYTPITIMACSFGFTRFGIWLIASPLILSWFHHAWIVFNDIHYSGVKKYFHFICCLSITVDLFLFTFGYPIAGFSLGFFVLIVAIFQRLRVMRRHTNIVEKAETCTTIVPLALLVLLGLSLITMWIDN
jgi:hypothetical protein